MSRLLLPAELPAPRRGSLLADRSGSPAARFGQGVWPNGAVVAVRVASARVPAGAPSTKTATWYSALLPDGIEVAQLTGSETLDVPPASSPDRTDHDEAPWSSSLVRNTNASTSHG